MEDKLLCTNFTLLHCFSLGAGLVFKYAHTSRMGMEENQHAFRN